MRLARSLVRSSYGGSRAISRLRSGTASIDVRASIFCTVREPVPHPLCGFYASAFTRLVTLFNLHARAEVVACRGTGKPSCVLRIAMADVAGAGLMRTIVWRGAIVAALWAAASASWDWRPSALAAQATPATPSAIRILVMPFENVKRDASIFWLGEASAVLLADNLNALGLSAITRPERQQAFERLQVPPAAVLTDATVIRIGQLVGAAQVIVGSLHREDDGLVVRARSLALEAGRVQADVTERGPVTELFDIFDRIARRLAPSSTPHGFDRSPRQ